MLVVPEVPASSGITIIPEAVEIRDQLVGLLKNSTVFDVASRDTAVKVVREARKHINTVEKDRKALKQPSLDFGRQIDKAASDHVEALEKLVKDVERNIGQFNDEQLRKQRELERIAREEAARKEQERLKAEQEAKEAAEKLVAATTTEERKEILRAQLEAEEKAAEAASPFGDFVPAAVKPSGGAQRFEITVTVLDAKALYAAQPSCVKLVPDLVQIKWMAEHQPNQPLPGVTITKTPIFNVRK